MPILLMKRIYLVLCLGFLVSCDIFDKEEDIPSFIVITSADLETTTEEGANTSNIVDATVFVDNFFVGTFELPATVPILQEGPAQISVAAGIRNNGLSSDRRVYPFYDFYRKEVSLIPCETISLEEDSSITFNYFDEGLNFVMEDFEDQGYDLLASSTSNADLNQPNLPTSYALEVLFTSDSSHFEARTVWDLVNLPKGSPMYLEIDYKGTVDLLVGIITVDPTVQKIFALGIKPQTEFTKVYIELTDEISRQISTNQFEIYFEADLPTGATTGSLYIDNLKFIYP